jgi:hypothetical protein
LATPVTFGTRSSLAVSACTAARVPGASTGGPFTSTTAVGPMLVALSTMAAPRADSEPVALAEFFSLPNSGITAASPMTSSSIQAASTHRRRVTQKRATVANMVRSPLAWLSAWLFMTSTLPVGPRRPEDGQP